MQDILKKHRLEHHLTTLKDLGVTCQEDLTDLLESDLKGFSVVEKRRFMKMVEKLQDLEMIDISGRPPVQTIVPPNLPKNSPHSLMQPYSQPVSESPKGTYNPDTSVKFNTVIKYCELQPLFSQRKLKVIIDVDLSSTLYQLMHRICQQEGHGSDITAQLYTPDGVPLSYSSVTGEYTLSDWKITSYNFFWVIFHSVEVTDDFSEPESMTPLNPNDGPDQIFVKAMSTMTINVDPIKDNGNTLRQKIFSKSKVPTSVISLSFGGKIIPANDINLVEYNIQRQCTVHMWCTPKRQVSALDSAFRADYCRPTVKQTAAGMSAFNSCLRMLRSIPHSNRLLGFIRSKTQSPPLVLALSVLTRKDIPNKAQRIAIHEGLYSLFRALVPTNPMSNISSGDDCVFEHSLACWNHLYSSASEEYNVTEDYTDVSLVCPICQNRMHSPVSYEDGGPSYDFECLQQKLDVNEAIPGLPSTCTLTDFKPNPRLMQLALAFPLSSSVTIWKHTRYMETDTLPQPANIQQMTAYAIEQQMKPNTVQPGSDIMHLRQPLDLKNFHQYPCLTLNSKNMIVVCTGIGKGTSKTHYIYDPWTGSTDLVNPDDLKASIDLHQNIRMKSNPTFAREGSITRTPNEAIVVLLDCSGSMQTEVFGKMTRLTIVKELFKTFADRSMAYNYHHVIGLTLFAETVTVISYVSESFVLFQAAMETVTAQGRTALWDAFTEAADQLSTISKKYPECLKRIICLTDGEDNESTHEPHLVAKLLQENQIVVDCILIGDGNLTAKSIAIATNGCAFKPENHTDSLRLFQMETILSIRERQMAETKALVTSKSILKKYSAEPYSTKPPRLMPSELVKTVTTPQHILRRAASNPPKGLGAPSLNRVKRILWELAEYQRDPHPCVEVYPCEEQIDFWRCLLTGPGRTPYENGVYLLYLKFPERYPQISPELRFETPIYHCNVNSHGKVCHSVFDRNYSVNISVRLIMNCVYGLLLTPEPDDPLDSALAEEYYLDRVKYEGAAKEMTLRYANKQLAVWRKELVGSESIPSDIPSHLTCPLTGKLMKNPVITPYGNTYERSAIEAKLQGSEVDPKAGKPLTRDQLFSNFSILEAVKEFERAQKQAPWYIS